jgi:hypothetical protein
MYFGTPLNVTDVENPLINPEVEVIALLAVLEVMNTVKVSASAMLSPTLNVATPLALVVCAEVPVADP